MEKRGSDSNLDRKKFLMSKRSPRIFNQINNIKCFPDSKRSQSEVITAVLLILIIIISIVIVWNMIYFFISSNTSKISGDVFSVKLDVPQTKLYITGGAEVQVSRGVGSGEITSLKFIFNKKSGETAIITKTINLPNELETKTYYFNASELSFNNSEIIKISVMPNFGKNNGIVIEETKDYSKDINGIRMLDINPSSGIISFWRLDGNYQDSIGNNHGGCTNCPTLTTDNHGNADRAFYFNGINNSITLSKSLINKVSNYTILFWINPTKNYNYTIYSEGYPSQTFKINIMSDQWGRTNVLQAQIWSEVSPTWMQTISSNNAVLVGKWNHIGITMSNASVGTGTLKFYLNGNLIASDASSYSSQMENFAATNYAVVGDHIGYVYGVQSRDPYTYAFNGSIDEIMMFNKTLSAQEIQILYNNQK